MNVTRYMGLKNGLKMVLFLFLSNFTHPVKKFRDPGGFEENLKNFHESVRNSKPKAKIRMTNGDFPNSRQSTINFLLLPSSLLYSREWHLPHRGDHAYSSMCLTRLGFGLVAMTSAAALINNDS